MDWLLKPIPTVHAIQCFLLIAVDVLREIIASVGMSIREIEINFNISIYEPDGVLFVHFLQMTPLTLYSMVQDGHLLIS